MTRRLPALLGLLLALPLAAADTQRYLIASRDGSPVHRLRTSTNAAGGVLKHVRTFGTINAFAADLTAEEAADLRSGDVIVEPVLEREAFELAPQSSLPSANSEVPAAQQVPWGITAINAPQIWPVTRGENVHVAVLDTGIDPNHADLKAIYAGGYNAFDAKLAPRDQHRHGTHVSGTIAAQDNEIGVVGVAPNVKLWAVKVLDDDGKGTSESIVSGLNWVIEQEAKLGGRWVVNFSLGSTLPSEVESLVVSRAIGEGIVIVAAAGNGAEPGLRYPARYDNVIAVGAVDDTDTRADFSSYGAGLILMAPGVNVLSTMIPGVEVSSDVKSQGETLAAWRITGSPFKSVTAKIADCGFGEPHEYPWDVAGKVALVHRGKLVFREIAKNAKDAGAAAVIIETYDTDNNPVPWTFYPSDPDPVWQDYDFPLGVGVSWETGHALIERGGDVTVTYRTAEYLPMKGTSMSSPHVAGTAALLLSLNPQLSIAQVTYALKATAHDLYTSGWDQETGWGLLDALAAAKFAAPERFGVPPPQPGPTPRRRSVQ
ncbi:MAG TPA: S8 family serine peptidase [Thermoanaerobaculia bacterium]|nr:S8 family serine peptidase [Thermoanaerobaculia bacterium]